MTSVIANLHCTYKQNLGEIIATYVHLPSRIYAAFVEIKQVMPT